MEAENNFLINLSVLYRNVQKYFDKALAPYDIGSGQLMFMLYINEHEGVTMQDATRVIEVDKGTTTKSIQKLIEQGYVQSRTDEADRRVRRLYTTDKTAEIMSSLYDYRNECRSHLAQGLDFTAFEESLDKACVNSRMYLNPQEKSYEGMRIGGMQKMTLLDYPDKVAATIFTGGCNFKCPFCHNKDLVFLPENYEFFDPEEVMEYLKKRKGLLDGVCISGGEPLLQDDLPDFIIDIKKLGYLVKLDTNGSYPDRLKDLIDAGLIDYVAMDIKNCPERYAETIGVNPDVFHMENIQKSIDLLQHGKIDYEFRTTVIRELHTKENLVELAKWIKGTKKYYLQQYMDSGNVIQPGWSAYDYGEMNELCSAVKEVIPTAELRGVKEG
ncbi:MAG: anaerobic ribonucleoside-triphosphate reductase activating protein [Solobacterium sp.]|jgi:anaerobic ribonucleoside-triphosphate reductase activating protein|nr:anaerobic ribonucleoside-triphosphate reductase activating protein [Solobacterium sp.]MCH4222481.1 anaerobic ribonucleoside-triphosphate reductase activating protein [Solobacterium sp.]MCH4266083.1 anaerobic ribonucleoside-triphosphate reductase activating protein [Solobacterium sp.]